MYAGGFWKKLNEFLFENRFGSNRNKNNKFSPELIGEWQSIHGYRLVIESNLESSYQKVDYLFHQNYSSRKGEILQIGDTLIFSASFDRRYFYIDKYPFQHQGKICIVLNGMMYTRLI